MKMLTRDSTKQPSFSSIINTNKKFELMLTRSVKAYSSSCLETVSLSSAISLQFILGVCAAAEN